MTDKPMYTSIRRYTVRPDSVDEVIKRAENGFVPIISKATGFLAYDVVNTGHNTLVTISTFGNQREADNSNTLAEGWVKENLASLITEPPTIMSGVVGVHKTK